MGVSIIEEWGGLIDLSNDFLMNRSRGSEGFTRLFLVCLPLHTTKLRIFEYCRTPADFLPRKKIHAKIPNRQFLTDIHSFSNSINPNSLVDLDSNIPSQQFCFLMFAVAECRKCQGTFKVFRLSRQEITGSCVSVGWKLSSRSKCENNYEDVC